MAQGWNQQLPPNDDDEIRAMKRANRTPIFVTLAVIGAVIVGCGLWFLRSYTSARSDLEAMGYTDVKVELHGPFNFGFSGTKDGMSCGGTMTRYPGSSSIQEMCFDATPAPKAPPPPSNRESIEKSLREHTSDLGFETATCPEIANADTKVTCKVGASTGVSVDAEVTRTEVGTAGDWNAWHIEFANEIENADKLGAKLAKAVAASVAKRHPGLVLDVDCGKGPLVFTRTTQITCHATSHDAKPLHATVVVSEKPDGGGMTWEETGL